MSTRLDPKKLARLKMLLSNFAKDDVTTRPLYAIAGLTGSNVGLPDIEHPEIALTMLANLYLGLAIGVRYPEYALAFLSLDPGKEHMNWLELCQDLVEIIPVEYERKSESAH